MASAVEGKSEISFEGSASVLRKKIMNKSTLSNWVTELLQNTPFGS